MNKKGFTLIELLAVIVIMGILMMVAIPTTQRYIENSRKDTFVNIAKEYVNAVKNLWVSDSLSCTKYNSYEVVSNSSAPNGNYFIVINSESDEILQSSTKSPWTKGNLTGFIQIIRSSAGDQYKIAIEDSDHNAISNTTGALLTLTNFDVDVESVSRNSITKLTYSLPEYGSMAGARQLNPSPSYLCTIR